jgi:hypothetical protein
MCIPLDCVPHLMFLSVVLVLDAVLFQFGLAYRSFIFGLVVGANCDSMTWSSAALDGRLLRDFWLGSGCK